VTLFSRVIQTRRGRNSADRQAEPTSDVEARVAALERQMARLESLIEGLQDATHRDAVRMRRDLQALQARTEPGEMARAIDEDTRERGL
jgi:uncharacterized coiled-coil protein SlyX